MLWPLFLVLLIIWIVHERWKRRHLYQLSKQIKCDLPAYPLVGHIHLFVGGGTDRMNGIKQIGREAIKQDGLTHIWIGPELFVVMTDVDSLQFVLKSCLDKHPAVRFIKLGTGNASAFARVPIWRTRRKVMAPIFSQNNLNMFVDIFSKQSNIMVSLLKQTQESFAIWNRITTYTMDSILETTLGYKSTVQDKPDHIILKPLEKCLQLVSERMFKPWLYPIAVYKRTSDYATFMKHKTAVDEFIAKVIKTETQAFKENRIDGSNKNVQKPRHILEFILQKDEFTDLEMQEEALVLLVAGTDTSAVGASYTTVMLSRHQDVQEKVFQEVMEVLGDTDRAIVAEDLPRLKYLDAVIRETLRLHPPAPAILRKVTKDVTLPSGITLVEGCGIVVNIWAVHRSPKYWGSDADEFRPERFFENYDKRAFMSFSSGPRNCIGYRYAMLSMKTMLASLIRQYRVLPAVEDITEGGLETNYKPVEETFDIMMKDVNKFMVKLERRK